MALPMLQRSNDFRTRPYSEATLEEHHEAQETWEAERKPWSPTVLGFLGRQPRGVSIELVEVELAEIPNLHRALEKRFSGWKLCGIHGPADNGWKRICCPTYQHFRIRPRVTRRYATEATFLFELPNGQRRVLDLEISRPCSTQIRLTGPVEHANQIHREFRRLVRAMRRFNYLRGQVIGANGRLLNRPRVGWHEVALPATTKELLHRNVMGTLDQQSCYRRSNVPQRRGILLYGPPGTGKTMIGKALASLGEATFIWATAADVNSEAAGVRSVFHLARRLRPTILFFEDLDFFAASREHFGRSTVLGELLTQMDGLEKNDGLIVIATTNDLAAIEPALKDRPSRFDVVLEIGLPEADARRSILQRQFGSCVSDAALLDAAVTATERMSGARSREFAILMLQEAIFRNAVDATGLATPTIDDLRTVAEKVNGKVHRPIGFTINSSCSAP